MLYTGHDTIDSGSILNHLLVHICMWLSCADRFTVYFIHIAMITSTVLLNLTELTDT